MNNRQKAQLSKLLMQGVDSTLMYKMIESFIENDVEANAEQWYSTDFCMPDEGQVVKYTLGGDESVEHIGAISRGTMAIHWCAITE